MPQLASSAELAALLCVSDGTLAWLADVRSLERRAGDERLRNYRYHWVARAGGGPPRAIERPKARLKVAQRVVLRELLDRIPAHPAAHGFVRRRRGSPRTIASAGAWRRRTCRRARRPLRPLRTSSPTASTGGWPGSRAASARRTRATQLMHQAGRQRVCGMVVNVAPNLAREEADRLRAILHDAVTHGPEHANRDDRPAFRAHLEGRVAWAAALNPAGELTALSGRGVSRTGPSAAAPHGAPRGPPGRAPRAARRGR